MRSDTYRNSQVAVQQLSNKRVWTCMDSSAAKWCYTRRAASRLEADNGSDSKALPQCGHRLARRGIMCGMQKFSCDLFRAKALRGCGVTFSYDNLGL